MSHLANLIAELCPRGVEFIPVGVASKTVRMPGQVKRQDYGLGSRFPIVDQSLDFIAGHTDEEDRVADVGQVVVFGDHTRVVKFVDFPFAQGADGIRVLQAAHGLTTKWLFHCLSHLDIPSRGYNRHWTVVRDLRIPVPPDAVQDEIVQVLDTFQSLDRHLKAELDARTQQYTHYRDSLLAFGSTRVRRSRLSELGSLYSGLTGKTKSDFQHGDTPYVPYMGVFSNLSVDTRPKTLVKVGATERQNRLKLGDVLFTMSSENLDEVGMASAVTVEPEGPLYLNSFCFGFRPRDPALLNPEFAKHLFRSAAIRTQIIKTANGVTRINISKERFREIEIPVPSPAEQARLAGLLDRFEELVNDSTGLPAEIKARQAQYEYYRDKLLTFEELSA